MTNNGNFDGLPEMIRKLTESPEIADIIKNAGIGEAQPQSAEAQPQKNDSLGGFSITPEMMEKLPAVMAALQGAGIGPQGPRTDTSQEAKPASGASPSNIDMNEIASKLPQVMSALSKMGVSGAGSHKPRSEDKNRKALLNALRPYMSDRKRDAIDAMLGMGSLAEIMMMLMGGEN